MKIVNTTIVLFFLFLNWLNAQVFMVSAVELQWNAQWTVETAPTLELEVSVPLELGYGTVLVDPLIDPPLIIPNENSSSIDLEWQKLNNLHTQEGSCGTEAGGSDYPIDWSKVPPNPDPNCLPEGWEEIEKLFPDKNSRYFTDGHGNYIRFDIDASWGNHYHWYNPSWLSETNKSIRRRTERYLTRENKPAHRRTPESHIKTNGKKPC